MGTESSRNPSRSNIWEKNGGIYIGYKTNTTKGVNPEVGDALSYCGDRHIMTLGPNGSGKTRRLLVPNLLGLSAWSMVIIDPKGELAQISAKHREANGSNVIILNPFGLFGLPSHGFNPIQALDPTSDDFPDNALSLADAVIKVSPHDRDSHWAQSAQDLVTALIMYARLTPVRPQEDGTVEYRDNFAFVRACLGKTADEFKDIVADMIKVGENPNLPCEELSIKAARFFDINAENRELNSIISTALTQSRWLDSRPIKHDLNGPVIDFAQLKETPTSVYLILPANRLATMSPWLRLVIAAIMQKLMLDVTKPKVPTLLMLEEMAVLGHMSVIESNVALMRGFGLKLWGVFQDLAQLKDTYSERWESFIGNAGVLNSFAPRDLVGSKYISELLGFETAPLLSAGSNTSPKDASATQPTFSHSVFQRPLMYPQEVRAMDDGFIVSFVHGEDDVVITYAPFYTAIPSFAAFAAFDPSL